MAKQYTSVSELVKDVAPDAETSAATEDRIQGRKLVKQLIAMRAIKEFSQHDVAQRLECTQSKISKLENSLDDDARLGDLRAYAKAVGCDFLFGLAPYDMKPVDKVKNLVFAIKKHMDDLAKLAVTDPEIANGVGGFFFELFVNFAHLIGESAKHLPLRPDQSPYFQVQIDKVQCGTVGIETACLADDDNPVAVAR
jgi:transcriptional regulator with XRE-family HTH domain